MLFRYVSAHYLTALKAGCQLTCHGTTPYKRMLSAPIAAKEQSNWKVIGCLQDLFRLTIQAVRHITALRINLIIAVST